MPNQGDILLVPIPFTDLSSQKRRPVIVISNNAYNLAKGTLNHPGKVRVDKIYAISKSIVVKTFGQVNEKVLERIRKELSALTGGK
ncbi:MAG: type II toxin-antitoxin system PemK/MazF family toxin [Chloroflexi bacterium]|nr:MAG: type II toxin-antitoxin system PemK/MazF family toxin [Chloroflexota bacterium]MCQ3938202.1 type II toxin-antitoxin system PemK/MazF family toxin [Chloroflexota bacterium]MDL1944752.1 type II toxin-antitoxin system PemK/MazF family toxin [Chloroflexi bacterium CFX2]